MRFEFTFCRPHYRRRIFIAALAASTLLGLPGGLRNPPTIARAADVPEDEAVPAKVRIAVDRALDWMAKNQKPDGTWQTGGGISTSVPSLAVMAFLARGHIPGQGKYGDTINKSIDYVLSQQEPSGLLSHTGYSGQMYEHGISTVMLSECFGMVDDTRKARIGKALAKSVALIIAAQKPKGHPKAAPNTGGWRYQVQSEDADLSVTGWQLMALRGAANCGATVPKEVLEAGCEYVRGCAAPTGGGFGYQTGGGVNTQLTGTGVLMLKLLGKVAEKDAPLTITGGDFLLAHPHTNPAQGHYYYGVYYISQAYNQLGGKYWNVGYPTLRDALLAAQSYEGDWDKGEDDGSAGNAYRTSMACLALCVPFKYLPLYQK